MPVRPSSPVVARPSPYLSAVIFVGYIVVGLGALLICQRAAVEHSIPGTFGNGLVTFIGWVGPLPFGVVGGFLAGRLWGLEVSAGFIGGLLWLGAAGLSIWQAFW